MKNILLAGALALAAANASAQTIYTSVRLDGHKTFSDRPDTTSDPAAEAEPPIGVPRTPAGTMAGGSRGATLVNINEAQRRLAQAQRKRQQGMDPLPGERSGAGDAGALNHRYWRRQVNLRLEVEQAQQRLNATRQPQLARR
jgi:hypothetical protein